MVGRERNGDGRLEIGDGDVRWEMGEVVGDEKRSWKKGKEGRYK